MTEEELEELISNCPTLYHMAERGSWQSIKKYGLLSTSALLEHYQIVQPDRDKIEKQHRSECVQIQRPGLPRAVVRDQKPMSDADLHRCLPDHLCPSDWYLLLNSKVFFWLSEDRLNRLTKARAYRDKEHDVLEVDTRSLVNANRKKVCLCPINSGCTKPFPHERDETIFRRISNYPYSHWKTKRSRQERVVELAVDHSVPDIVSHVQRVVVRKGDQVLRVL